MDLWAYEMQVPDDVEDDELEGYRELAVATWRTGAEASGGFPGDPTTTLVDVDRPAPRTDPATGEKVAGPRRVWHVQGPVT